MKKTDYMAPEMETINMKLSGILCSSTIGGGSGTGFSREANEMDDEE